MVSLCDVGDQTQALVHARQGINNEPHFQLHSDLSGHQKDDFFESTSPRVDSTESLLNGPASAVINPKADSTESLLTGPVTAGIYKKSFACFWISEQPPNLMIEFIF